MSTELKADLQPVPAGPAKRRLSRKWKILIGVALDTMKQLEAQLMMRNYQSFIR